MVNPLWRGPGNIHSFVLGGQYHRRNNAGSWMLWWIFICLNVILVNLTIFRLVTHLSGVICCKTAALGIHAWSSHSSTLSSFRIDKLPDKVCERAPFSLRQCRHVLRQWQIWCVQTLQQTYGVQVRLHIQHPEYAQEWELSSPVLVYTVLRVNWPLVIRMGVGKGTLRQL